jgi:predicted RecA/RadA family phage recombinase
MTTLAANDVRSYEQGDMNDLPVIASDIIYEGAAVGDNGTNAHRPLVAGDRFAGFAVQKADNAAGAAGAITVWVRTKGRIQLPISSFDVTDVGKPVFASDDDTFTLTQGANSHIGKAVRFVATGSTIVEFDAHNPPPGLLTELTDSSGGTASDTLAAIVSTYVEATIENTVASLAAKVNAIIRQMKG